MSGDHPGLEVCPYCKKQFKRLKSHLPYCKAARSTDVSGNISLAKKGSSSAVPRLLNTEKKKGQVQSTEATSKNENKKNKPELGKNKTKGKANSSQGPAAKCSTWHGGEDTQIKGTSVTTSGTGGSSQNASEDGQAQPVEKVASKASAAEKPSRIKKSRRATASGEAGLASDVDLEPNMQSAESTSELPSQDTRYSYKQSPSEEATPAEQKVSRWFDFSIEDLPPVPREVDRLELVIENHRARLLKRKGGSSVHKDVTVGNGKTGPFVDALPGGEEFGSTKGQKATAVTERVDRKSIVSLELAGDVLNGGAVTRASPVDANTASDQVTDSCATISSLPVLLSRDMKNTANGNTLLFKEDEYPKKSPGCTTPKPKIGSSGTDTLQEKGDVEVLKNDLTRSEKDIPLRSRTAGALDYKNPGVPLRQLSVHTPEMAAAHWLAPLDRGTRPSSLGLEWFPELYPNYRRLGLFPRRSAQWSPPVIETQVPVLPCKEQQVSLAERRLMNVRLQELPDWLATRDLSPQGMLRATCRAWNSHYNKYIIVKRSGVVGISMLLLGCCTLGYAWSYEHMSKASFLTCLIYLHENIATVPVDKALLLGCVVIFNGRNSVASLLKMCTI